MIEKSDDALASVNDFLRTLTDRVTPNIVLVIAIVNGFIIGLATTGYLGEMSLSVSSLPFALIIWQLVIICVFSSRYIDLTTGYLNKFIICGVIGYVWQWQFFGMYANAFAPEITTITPPMENGVISMILGYFSIMFLFGYCLKGNKKNTGSKVFDLKDRHVS